MALDSRADGPASPNAWSCFQQKFQQGWVKMIGVLHWPKWTIPSYISKRLNFYRLHLLYFLLLDLIGTMVIWLSPSTSLGQISFIDALFNSTSALTVTGLASVKMATFSVFNQVVLLILMLLGGQVFTSLLPVLVRRYYFHERMKETIKEDEEQGLVGRHTPEEADEHHSSISAVKPEAEQSGQPARPLGNGLRPIIEHHLLGSSSSTNLATLDADGNSSNARGTSAENSRFAVDEIKSESGSRFSHSTEMHNGNAVESGSSLAGSLKDVSSAEAAFPEVTREVKRIELNADFPHSHTWAGESAQSYGHKLKTYLQQPKTGHMHGSSMDEQSQNGSALGEYPASIFADSLARNDSEAYDASKLRTKEYRALRTLSWLVPVYLMGLQVLAFIVVRLNFLAAAGQRRTLAQNDVNSTFFSGFQVVSAFQNAGYGLLDSSLIEFDRAILFLHVMGILILLGNTLYAPTMRGIIYALAKFTNADKEELGDPYGLQYLLDHPRKCFTHLFPWHQTLWLVITVIAFNAVEVFFFCVLDWNSAALKDQGGGYKFFDGLFQSLNTRSSGFSVVPIANLSPSMLVLYAGMMYVAVYPVYLSRQTSQPKTEVVLDRETSADGGYDNAEVGVFSDELVRDESLVAQGRVLLFRDSAFLFMTVFLVSIVQSSEIRDDPNFNIFPIIFEIISAYGNVGLSVGYTCVVPTGEECESPPYSFSGVWKPLSKLLIILVMLMGRHRGLPENIDMAVRIPPKETFKKGTVVGSVDHSHALFLDKVRKQKEQLRGPSLFRRLSRRFESPTSTTPTPALRKTSSLPDVLRTQTSLRFRENILSQPAN